MLPSSAMGGPWSKPRPVPITFLASAHYFLAVTVAAAATQGIVWLPIPPVAPSPVPAAVLWAAGMEGKWWQTEGKLQQARGTAAAGASCLTAQGSSSSSQLPSTHCLPSAISSHLWAAKWVEGMPGSCVHWLQLGLEPRWVQAEAQGGCMWDQGAGCPGWKQMGLRPMRNAWEQL